MWISVEAKLAGTKALSCTSVLILTVPAFSGKVVAFKVMAPTPRGNLHTTSLDASPLQDATVTPLALMVVSKDAPVTSSLRSPVPTTAVVVPVSMLLGLTSLNFVLEPQSWKVTLKVLALAVAKSAAAATLTMVRMLVTQDRINAT